MKKFAVHRAAFRKVDDDEVEQIRSAVASGETLASVASRLGRSPGTISKVLTGKRYEAPSAPAPTRRSPPAPRAQPLAHVKSDPWSPEWYREQDEAFRAAFRSAHGEAASYAHGGHYPETSNAATLSK